MFYHRVTIRFMWMRHLLMTLKICKQSVSKWLSKWKIIMLWAKVWEGCKTSYLWYAVSISFFFLEQIFHSVFSDKINCQWLIHIHIWSSHIRFGLNIAKPSQSIGTILVAFWWQWNWYTCALALIRHCSYTARLF